MLSPSIVHTPVLFFVLYGLSTLTKGTNAQDLDGPLNLLDDLSDLLDLPDAGESHNPIEFTNLPMHFDSFNIPANMMAESGQIIDSLEVVSAIADDLFQYEFGDFGASTGLIPKFPSNAGEYDVECTYGSTPWVPEQLSFPIDRQNPYYSLDYPSLYDVCSLFTRNNARHLAFACRNP
jgi:hypothetical protein